MAVIQGWWWLDYFTRGVGSTEGKERLDSRLVVMPGGTLWKQGVVWGAQDSGQGWLGGGVICKARSGPEPELPADDASLVVFQVNEIYHDESLGAHINVVLVRIILLSYGKVSECPPLKVFASPKPPVSPSRLPCASCQTQEIYQSTLLSSSAFTLAPCFTCRFCYYSGVVRLTHQEVTDMEKMVIPHRSCHAGSSGKHQVWSVGRRREGRAPL